MLYKIREESKVLRIMEALDARMELGYESRKYLKFLQRGYGSEEGFDPFPEMLTNDHYTVNDLSLMTPLGRAQYDAIILKGDTLRFYEIKSFYGNHNYGVHQFCKLPDFDFDNPVIQLTKQKNRIQSLLKKHGFHLNVESYVVFMDSSFVLYNMPLGQPYLFVGQLAEHFRQMDAVPSNNTCRHQELIDLLMANQIEEPWYDDIPDFTFESLKKGVYCEKCKSFDIQLSREWGECSGCGHQEKIANIIQRNIQEYKLLFPDKIASTYSIRKWCDDAFLHNRIYRELTK